MLRAVHNPHNRLTNLTLEHLDEKRVHHHSKTDLLHTLYWLEWKSYIKRGEVDGKKTFYRLTQKGEEMYRILRASNEVEEE